MGSVISYTKAAMERAMKSDIAGVGQENHLVAGGRDHRHQRRQMQRWRERYEEFGRAGLFDRRRGRPSPKLYHEIVLGLTL